MLDHEAEGLVDHIQHCVEGFAVAAGHGGRVSVRNLKPLVVWVGDLRRDSCVVVVVLVFLTQKMGTVIVTSSSGSEALRLVSLEFF